MPCSSSLLGKYHKLYTLKRLVCLGTQPTAYLVSCHFSLNAMGKLQAPGMQQITARAPMMNRSQAALVTCGLPRMHRSFSWTPAAAVTLKLGCLSGRRSSSASRQQQPAPSAIHGSVLATGSRTHSSHSRRMQPSEDVSDSDGEPRRSGSDAEQQMLTDHDSDFATRPKRSGADTAGTNVAMQSSDQDPTSLQQMARAVQSATSAIHHL